MSLSDINTKLHQIESDICILSNMIHSLRVSTANDHKQFQTYLRLVTTQQIQLEKTLWIISANLDISTIGNKRRGIR